MKKILQVLLSICLVAMLVAPVAAFNLPDDGVVYPADAIADFPDDFDGIYGIQFDATLDSESVMEGFGALFWVEVYVDDGEEAESATQNFLSPGAIGLLAAGGFTVEPSEMVEIDAGETKTITYLSDDPLFSPGASIAKVRISIFESAVAVGVKFDVENVKWLDEAGSVYTGAADETPSPSPSPAPGDGSVVFYVVTLFVAAAAIIFLSTKRIKGQAR